MKLELGRKVRCTDAPCGELSDVVVDPVARRVTHLVVQPHDHHEKARLVPIDLAGGEDDGDIVLRCTSAELAALDPVQELAYLRVGEAPVEDPHWDVGIQDVLAMPYYDAVGIGGYAVPYDPSMAMSYDRVPKGEVEIRRTSPIWSKDGHHLGHADGFVVEEDHITHVVLERGHLWGKREVTIPIGAVDQVVNDAVTLTLTKDEVGELPSVRVNRWRQ